MILEVLHAKYLRDYVIWVKFNDGSEGEVDLGDELEGPVFGPLRDTHLFKAVRVDQLLRTVVWPNEADLAPEFLVEKLKSGSHKGRQEAKLDRIAKHGQEDLIALREIAAEPNTINRKADVPIKVRRKRSAFANQPAMVREDSSAYGSSKPRKA